LLFYTEGKEMRKKVILLFLLFINSLWVFGQINTDRVLTIGRNALYFEDYVLSIQYFNQVIKSKPWLAEPYFYRAVAKINLDDFKGAEEDCTLCLQRNPFYVQAYYARGIARQSQEKYDEAIEDYQKGIEFRPGDRQMLINMAVAYLQKEDYDGAEETFDVLMGAFPNYAMNYLTRGAMYLEKGDTISALQDYNKSIELDPYYASSYGNRALVYFQMKNYDDALVDLNEAIRLNTREGGFYINRGLVRYYMNDLRGAMSDYDQVINMGGQNLIARFNRGLLRAQVGDSNRAIEDFDVVIELEPENYIAYYNRALLRFETADYLGAIKDFDVVLAQYPNFTPGYYSRAEAKRRTGDSVGADRDRWTAFQKEEEGASEKGQDNSSSASNDSQDDKTREESDKNINKFNRLVVYDKEEESKSQYRSEIRGRVQDKNVRVDIEPLFILTYYEKPDAVKRMVYYDQLLEDYNRQMILSRKLLLTNQEAALNEDQVTMHFTSVNNYSAQLDTNPNDINAYFGRAIDYMLVQDFSEALLDFDRVVAIDPSFVMAYFNRAAVRYKQLEYMLSQVNESNDLHTLSTQINIGAYPQLENQQIESRQTLNENKRAYEQEMIIRDYDMVIKLNPDFVYAYFNRGNLRCAQHDFRAAIQDYNDAILRDPEFAEAYFNRGLARLSLGDADRGVADLSKAGELGIISAYSIIKRMTNR